MKEKRIAELDYARVVLMLSVIAIHVTSSYIFSESRISLFGMNLAYLINQAARCSVPGFIILSGASLGMGKTEYSIGSFYISRMKKIVLPYLIWYTVYFAYNSRGTAVSAWDFAVFFKGILKGSTAPHLYFIIVIVQLYILYPLLRRLVGRHKCAAVIISFAAGLGFQTLSYLACLGVHLLPYDNLLYLSPLTWIHFFVLGMCVPAGAMEKLCRWAKRRFPLLILLSAAAALGYALESRALSTYDTSVKPHLFLYAPLILVTALGFGACVKKYRTLNRFVGFLSRVSMDVYFCHVIVIKLLRPIAFFSRGMSGMLLLFAAVTIVSVLLAAAIGAVKKALKNFSKRKAAA